MISVDTELVTVGSPADASFNLGDLPANAQVEVAISAVNNHGESAQSAIIKIATR